MASIITIGIVLSSCRTQFVPLPAYHSHDSLVIRVNTFVDSICEKDSISFSFMEIPAFGGQPFKGYASDGMNGPPQIIPVIHHWHARSHDRVVSHTDTVTITRTDSIPYPVEVPVETDKPVPKFYTWCTGLFWLLLLVLIGRLALRIYLRR